MANDGALRAALVWLAVAVVAVGMATWSVKKMGVTYLVGMVGIAGVVLPDWDYFDRDVSEWFQPLTVPQINPGDVHRIGSNSPIPELIVASPQLEELVDQQSSVQHSKTSCYI